MMMTNIETLPGFHPYPRATHVLFDLDGTISLVRGGWAELMLETFLERIPRLPGESETQLRAMLLDDMLRQNGRPSIHQMIRFGERLKERGCDPGDPEVETNKFVRRLQGVANQRREDVLSGRRPLESVLVPGVLRMLDLLKEREMKLYLASGTIARIVLPEVEQMGLRRYFEDRVYAPESEQSAFSKEKVIADILSDEICPEQFIAFGDGYVEIHETKRVGGLAIAVASDEVDPGSGKMDVLKRNLLAEVGASMVIADYRDPERILSLIFGF